MPKADAQALEPSRPPTRQARGSISGTRDALLKAAATAISRHGWGAVTTRQIAGLANVNPALVHYHFGSMDALRREAVVAAMAEELEGPMAALLADVPLSDAIAATVDEVARIDPGSERFALLYEALLESARDDALRTILAQAYAVFRGALADRIRTAGGAEPEAAAIVITAALDGVLLHRLVRPDLDVVPMVATLVAALQIPPAPPAETRPGS